MIRWIFILCFFLFWTIVHTSFDGKVHLIVVELLPAAQIAALKVAAIEIIASGSTLIRRIAAVQTEITLGLHADEENNQDKRQSFDRQSLIGRVTSFNSCDISVINFLTLAQQLDNCQQY